MSVSIKLYVDKHEGRHHQRHHWAPPGAATLPLRVSVQVDAPRYGGPSWASACHKQPCARVYGRAFIFKQVNKSLARDVRTWELVYHKQHTLPPLHHAQRALIVLVNFASSFFSTISALIF